MPIIHLNLLRKVFKTTAMVNYVCISFGIYPYRELVFIFVATRVATNVGQHVHSLMDLQFFGCETYVKKFQFKKSVCVKLLATHGA